MKKLWSEFYEFIAKGNVIGLAVGLMMGAAFNSIITSMIDDILMPIISVITSGISFNQWFIALNGQSYETLALAQEAGAPIMTVVTAAAKNRRSRSFALPLPPAVPTVRSAGFSIQASQAQAAMTARIQPKSIR